MDDPSPPAQNTPHSRWRHTVLFLPLTLQQLGIYEQLQRQQQHHEDDTGHEETVEARW